MVVVAVVRVPGDRIRRCTRFCATSKPSVRHGRQRASMSAGARSPGACHVGSLLIAGMQNYLVSGGNQKLSRHLSQPVG